MYLEVKKTASGFRQVSEAYLYILIVRILLSRSCSWDFCQSLRVPNVLVTSWTPSFFRPDLQRKPFWFSYANRVQKVLKKSTCSKVFVPT